MDLTHYKRFEILHTEEWEYQQSETARNSEHSYRLRLLRDLNDEALYAEVSMRYSSPDWGRPKRHRLATASREAAVADMRKIVAENRHGL